MAKVVDGLSDRFQVIQAKLGYNYSDLARFCDVTPTAISNIAEGKTQDTKLSLVQKISNKLGISFDWLINGEGEMFKEGAKVNSNHNIISKSKDIKNNIQSQGGVTTTNSLSEKDEVVKLREEVVFLKEQLKFTQGLLQDALKK